MLTKLEFKKQAILVDGQWIAADSDRTIAVTDPATGETIGTIPNAGQAETRRAIQAAHAAFPAWRAKTAAERAALLLKLAELIRQNSEALAHLLTQEQGKPLAEARGEIGSSAAYVQWFAEEVAKMRVGSGFEAGVQIGPLIDTRALAKVKAHLDDILARGGEVVTGGKGHALGGTFFEPTVVKNVPQDARVATEETFGPLAPIFRFETEAEVVGLANATEYGLAAYFYTRDLARAFRVSEALKYGMVGVNEGLITTEVAPFGGVKESGVGREGSRHGLEDYLDMKYVCLGGIA